jgi:hypothetical protein
MNYHFFDKIMDQSTPWYRADWLVFAEGQVLKALNAVNLSVIGSITTVKTWGRSCLQTVETSDGLLWIKHGYRLPPGEEKILEALSSHGSEFIPEVVAIWDGGFAMRCLPGEELTESHPRSAWVFSAVAIAELACREADFVDEWLALGVRDRRPMHWADALDTLMASPVVRAIEPDLMKQFETLLPEFISRYIDAFEHPATLIHQDSGCCNIHVSDQQPVIFDWADVVIGHPTFSCDRLLDQVPVPHREDVIEAFIGILDMDRVEFNAMMRSNVLHEILRYHDELRYVPVNSDIYESLVTSVQSQIRVLVEHEMN